MEVQKMVAVVLWEQGENYCRECRA